MRYTYPEIISDIRDLFVMLAEAKAFESPASLIEAYALALGLIGVSNFAIVSLRAAISQPWRRPLLDVRSRVCRILFTASSLSIYSQGLLTRQTVLLTLLVVAGLLIIYYGIVNYIFKNI